MSHQHVNELPEHLIDLGHQLFSYHQSQAIRQPEFQGLIKPFLARYPAPEPALNYPPAWLSDTQARRAAIHRFTSEAQPLLTPLPPSPRTRTTKLQPGQYRTRPDLHRPLFGPPARGQASRPTKREDTAPTEYEIDRNMPPADGFTPAQLDQITNLLGQVIQAILQSQTAHTGQQGPPGPPG